MQRLPDSLQQGQRVRVRNHGPQPILEVAEFLVPELSASCVRIEVAAVGLNRADLLESRGHYPAPSGEVQDGLGLEFSGIVTQSRSDFFAEGQRVMGITSAGAFSNPLDVHQGAILEVPETWDLKAAAGVPEAYLTAFDALFRQASLSAGDVVLIHAVASGVGLAAAELTTAAGGVAVGTTRTADKAKRISNVRPVEVLVIDGPPDFASRLGVPANIIVDTVGGTYFEENLNAAAQKCVIVHLGLVGGTTARLKLNQLLQKRVSLIGSVLRSRSSGEKQALTADFAVRGLPLLIRDNRPRWAEVEVVPLRELDTSLNRLERSDTFGKVVVPVSV